VSTRTENEVLVVATYGSYPSGEYESAQRLRSHLQAHHDNMLQVKTKHIRRLASARLS
jgi:hypothetical protein